MPIDKEKLILKDQLNQTDIDQVVKSWQLDPTIFTYPDSPIEIARFIPLNSNKLKNGHLLVTFVLLKDDLPIEQKLTPIFTIFNQTHLFIGTKACFPRLKPEKNIIETILQNLHDQSQNIYVELVAVKKEIDLLDKNARKKTKRNELQKLTDLTRELVYLKHTLDDQTPSLEKFGTYLIDNQLITKARVQSIMTEQRRITKMIHVYTDLLNSISGLFKAMMDNRLNHLMQYLDSIALVIAIPGLISGIWGMNIGGLPGQHDKNGFWVLMAIAIVLTIILGIFLKKKKYSN